MGTSGSSDDPAAPVWPPPPVSREGGQAALASATVDGLTGRRNRACSPPRLAFVSSFPPLPRRPRRRAPSPIHATKLEKESGGVGTNGLPLPRPRVVTADTLACQSQIAMAS